MRSNWWAKNIFIFNLPVFPWRRVVLRFFNPKRMLQVSCILWCYILKCYSIILQNANLWCFNVVYCIYDSKHWCRRVFLENLEIIAVHTVLIGAVSSINATDKDKLHSVSSSVYGGIALAVTYCWGNGLTFL